MFKLLGLSVNTSLNVNSEAKLSETGDYTMLRLTQSHSDSLSRVISNKTIPSSYDTIYSELRTQNSEFYLT